MSFTAIIFVLCFSAGLILCLSRHPMYGLYTYLAVFYLHPPSRWWGLDVPDLRWSFIAAGTTFAVTILRKHDDRPLWLTNTPILLFVIYVAWMWIQWPWVLNETEHSIGLNFFTKYIIVLFIIYKLVDTRERLRGFMLANALGCLYLGYLAHTANVSGRLDGIGGPGINDSNSLGMHLSAVLFFAASLYLVDKSWRRWLAAISILFMLNTVVLAGSRGAFLAIVIGGVALYLLRPARQLKYVILYMLLGLGLFAYLANDFFWDRMTTITAAAERSESMDNSAASRFVIIEAQLEIAKAFPFGGGHHTTAELSDQYIPLEYHASQGGRSSHNSFMSALVDQGIPGFVIWVAIVFVLAKYNLAIRRFARKTFDTELAWINAGIGAGIVVVLVGGMFAPFLKAEIYIWLIAVTCSLRVLAFEKLEPRTTKPAGIRKNSLSLPVSRTRQ